MSVAQSALLLRQQFAPASHAPLEIPDCWEDFPGWLAESCQALSLYWISLAAQHARALVGDAVIASAPYLVDNATMKVSFPCGLEPKIKQYAIAPRVREKGRGSRFSAKIFYF
jgi:hypothetical protein